MTRSYILSTALMVLIGIGGISPVGAAESTHPALTSKTLNAAVSSAQTSQDHQRIANYYKGEAIRMLAVAKEHDELAVVYTKSPRSEAPIQPAEHCKNLADAARKSAKESEQLANLHVGMAKSGK